MNKSCHGSAEDYESVHTGSVNDDNCLDYQIMFLLLNYILRVFEVGSSVRVSKEVNEISVLSSIHSATWWQ